jgi:uncharacterized protein YqfA (UPF0365 family)
MDYYRMQNLQADTSMRGTLAQGNANEGKPNKG